LVGGVVRAEFAERAVWWSSGLLDPEVRLVGLRRRREALHGGAKRSEGETAP